MKIQLALAAASVLTLMAHSEEWYWFQPTEQVEALLYDGTGGAFEFDPGDIFPVSRVLLYSELDADQKSELPKATKYVVIPLSSKSCAVAPLVNGAWVNATSPHLASKLSEWKKLDQDAAQIAIASLRQQAASPETKSGRAPSSQRYHAKVLEQQQKARRDAELAAQIRQAQELQNLRKAVEDLKQRR